MRRILVLFLLFLVLLLSPLGIRWLHFYEPGGADHTPPADYVLGDVPALVPTPAFRNVALEALANEGLVLLDRAHDNEFTLDEIAFLDGQLAARGYELVEYTGEDLAASLRQVSAFVVITPLKAFTTTELLALERFVARGGRLLLLGDPTRYVATVEEDDFGFIADVTLTDDELPLNRVANPFGIVFGGDYLYNTVENEGNFRNIIVNVAGESEDEITADLEKVVFYGSHSVRVSRGGQSIFAAGENTWSSATDRPGNLHVGALSANGQVLALGDFSFLIEPYATAFDNAELVANIAEFLILGERDFVLADFPYFYARPVDLIYTGTPDLGPNAFEEIVRLQDAFRDAGLELSLASDQADGHDAIFLGLYNQAESVKGQLEAAGIALAIEPPIEAPDSSEQEADEPADVTDGGKVVRQIRSPLGNVQMSGTALLLLDEGPDGQVLVALAASQAGLESVVDRLLALVPRQSGTALADCLLGDNLAFCPTDVSEEPVEYAFEADGLSEESAADAPSGEETGPDEEEAGESDADAAFDPAEVGARLVGTITLGDSVSETLDGTEAHAWHFVDAPATVDIRVQPDDETVDLVLSLYDAAGKLVEDADSGFSGDDEWLVGVELPEQATYTIVVADFYDEGGSYSLSVTESVPAEGVLIFADDDGEPQTSGFTSAEAYLALIGDRRQATIWRTSEDGPLTLETLLRYEAVIWTTGDYRNEDAFDDPDGSVLLNFLLFGESGRILISGATPPLFEPAEVAALADVVVADTETPLLAGFDPGESLPLEQAYEVVLLTEDFLDDEDQVLLRRGPDSDSPGEPVALASEDLDTNTRVVLLGLPFASLPETARETLLSNILDWLFADG